MTMREVWMPVPGLADLYEVSNLGRVISNRTGQALAPAETGGYLHVTLVDADGGKKNHRVHVLVLSSFCGLRPFPGAHAAHNDGNSKNNRLDNLRWATAIENQADVERHERRVRGEDVFGSRLTEGDVRKIRTRLGNKERYPEIAKDFGVSVSTISLVKLGRTWSHVK